MRSSKKPSKRQRSSPSTSRDQSQNFPVVGIGVSAGGLEAVLALLKAIPDDIGMAFVLVPHLDPSHESAYTQILSRQIAMSVVEVVDGIRVQPNHVYVIPPNCELTIENSTLQLRHLESSRPLRATIDIFLRSLAFDQKNNAIGVILSGTGSDGTVGLTAIKGEGGSTFAQDSESAKYDSMPASAVAAGCVDLVYPPQEIAKELTRLRQHPYVARSVKDEEKAIPEDGGESMMAHIFRLLRRSTKVDFSDYKPPTIGRRIQRRMVLQRISKLHDYVLLLQRNPAEVMALYHDLLINVTSFFRNAEAFEALRQVVYPQILKSRPNLRAPLRLWVPGCSTGEEAYSHAISLVEYLAEERVEVPIQIFGTDLSEAAIQRARSGVYKETIEADVSPIRLRRFFHRVDSGYQISKTVRDLCIFSTQNVFSDPPFSRIDLVSCRNVMIYLSQTLQRRVIPIFHYALNPSGFLMIGNTEGLLGAGSELFEMADKKQKIYRKKMVATPMAFGFSMAGQQSDVTATNTGDTQMTLPKPVDLGRTTAETQREADRLLLSRYVPPAVVINSQLEILQTRGHTGQYLELPSGKVSLNLLKMARPGLLYELQAAVDEARNTGAETQRNNVPIEGNGRIRSTSVRVIPFKTPVHDQPSFLIVFEPPAIDAESSSGSPNVSAGQPLGDDERSVKDRQFAQLKQELAATKEYLQSIIETHEATNEELQSANEEIQSSNEELQSTNEELQTSKEELESANEELHTVNEEMQHRNELLAQLNNDLNNLLTSVNLPMVMVGADLSVRRFTAQAGAVLGLLPSDIGRQIPRLKLKIDSKALENMILDVIEHVQPKQFKTQIDKGRQCNLRVNPYRTMDNRIEGAVLSIVYAEESGIGKAGIKNMNSGEKDSSKSAKSPAKSKKK